MSPKPSLGLFDKIICAVHAEKELRQTRKILFTFVSFLIGSLGALPFSSIFLIMQWRRSGAMHFIASAPGNTAVLFALWQEFLLSIVESLPLMAITLFAINVALVLFTVRLFIYRKGVLLSYFSHNLYAIYGKPKSPYN